MPAGETRTGGVALETQAAREKRNEGTKKMTKLTDLTEKRRRLVELMQRINFGRVENLHVRNSEPGFDPPPRIFRVVKFGCDNGPRPEKSKEDFEIKAKVLELFAALEEMGDGVVERLDIQYGLPCGMLIQEAVA